MASDDYIKFAYLKKYKDAVILFYPVDSEFGSPQSYFTQFGIDPARVLHTPIMNVEQLLKKTRLKLV